MKLLVLIILLIITLIIFYLINYRSMTFLRSPIDNRYYMVRDLPDKEIAVNTLAQLRNNILILLNHLNMYKDTKYSDYGQYITQLSDRITDVTVGENRESSTTTSYSVNKGEELVVCLRSREQWNKMHNKNILMYVILHEIAHIACPEFGHTPLFKKIFAFLTYVAVDLKLYEKIDFDNRPEEYCGIKITSSII